METQLESSIPVARAEPSLRVRAISLLGPLTVVGGLAWAVLQPYRLTLLHPHHQGFWWLAVEPQLLVAAAGLFFALAIAPPLIADLEGHDGATR